MKSSGRIPSLDGLRAISIVLVIVGHLRGGGQIARFGVDVFFVISGYLITTLLQREYERTGAISLSSFYRRRCFRILPAALTYIAIIGIVSPASRYGLIYVLTFTSSYHATFMPVLFAHLWSLSIEEQFYLLWPVLLVLNFRRRATIACGAMAIAAIFRVVMAFSPYSTGGMVHYSFPGTMDSIAAGCLLAIYEPVLRERLVKLQELVVVLMLAGLAYLMNAILWGSTYSPLARALCVLWGIVPALIAVCVLLLIQRQDFALNNRLMASIGVGSYSLYLWQQPFTVHGAFSPIPAVGLAVCCATISYFAVERPLLRIGGARERTARLATSS